MILSANAKNEFKVAFVFPAYNAEQTLERTLSEIPEGTADFLILVDDASSDSTAELARKLGMTVVVHSRNLGYGANQKTCYSEALSTDADCIIMLHPDNQYDARVSIAMIDLIRIGVCDVILGNRIRTRSEALNGGMPRWKYLINRTSTFFENLFLGQSIGDFHSGFRAYSREALEVVPFLENSDDFAFDQEFLMQAIFFNFKIGDVPVPVRYMKEASSISFKRSVQYGLGAVNAFLAMKMTKWNLRTDSRFKL